MKRPLWNSYVKPYVYQIIHPLLTVIPIVATLGLQRNGIRWKCIGGGQGEREATYARTKYGGTKKEKKNYDTCMFKTLD